MKKKIIDFVNKNKKYCIVATCGIGVFLIGILSWNLIFSKYYIFSKQETKFINAAKRYYEYHSKYLPGKGEAKELTLQQLYDLDQIEDLYVPKSNKVCDTNSWVRVYQNEEGEYKYLAYLKCGKYHSHIDHEGPSIKINGDGITYVALNNPYQEEGVKEIKDNKDKTLTVDKVVIDSSKVDTSKKGTYKVTYTARDSKYNKTVVTRQVIVTQGFSDTVRNSVSSDGYYKGNSDNYVLFSGMLWRVVRINEDGTVKMILNEPVNNLRVNYENYEDSNIDTWLNEVFLNALVSKNYLVDTEYCVGNINSMIDYGSYCSTKVKRKVGLLDISEYYSTYSGNSTSILSKSFTLGHKIGDNYADAAFYETNEGGKSTAIIAPIRPVITVNASLNILSGNGSFAKPYKLNDYNYGKKNDKLNSRIVGEYFEYSGMLFRIMKIDKDKNVRVISDGEWQIKPGDTKVYISTEGLDKWSFNTKKENEPGYMINNDYLDYIDTKSIKNATYEIPINDASKKYNEYKTTKIKAKIVLPKTYDLFAAVGSADYLYTFIDRSTNDQMLFMANTANGKVLELAKESYNTYSIKIVMTLNGDLTIESGNGSVNKPYVLQ